MSILRIAAVALGVVVLGAGAALAGPSCTGSDTEQSAETVKPKPTVGS